MMSRKTGIIRTAILLLACFWTCVCSEQSVCAKSLQDDKFREIDRYLSDCAKRANIPALAVTIVEKDRVLFSQAYGDCENCDTPFFLGSVSKSFTAVGIMQLAERGSLDLDAHISVYLPDVACGDSITVRQLLNHTGGLGEHQTLEQVQIVNEQGVHNYANVNYTLLGEILEAVSGQSYRDYMTENLFEPLRLAHTAAGLRESEENGLIDGYTNYWGIPVKSRHKLSSSENAWITVPAGYISSSANDLGSYLQMYLNGGDGILSEQSIDAMFYGDTVYVDDDVPYWYGYGWAMVRDPLPEPVLRHSGLIETGTSCVFLLPESGLGVAITCNMNDYFVTNELLDRLGWGVVLLLLDETPEEIAEHEYLLAHIRIDLMMLAFFVAAVLSLCLLPKYAGHLRRGKSARAACGSMIAGLLFAGMTALLVPVGFRTPLWVARAFVPDVFLTVAVSSALFAAGALARAYLLFRYT